MASKTDRFMPLEIEPWTKKTARLPAAARGAYMDLILAQWRGETLPADDDDALMRLARCTESEWAAVRAKVLPYFTREGDVLIQQRASNEKAKANQMYERKASNGEAGGKASGKQRRSKKEANGEADTKLDPKQTPSASEHISTLEQSPNGDDPHTPKGAYPEKFEAWYSGEGIDGYDGYPHKVGKDQALKNWQKREKEGALPDLQTLIAAVKRYIATKPADQAWCNPGTWISGGRWMDQPAAFVAPKGSGGREVAETPRSTHVARYRGWYERGFWPPLAGPKPPKPGFAGEPGYDMPRDVIEEVERDCMPAHCDTREKTHEAAE